MKLIALHSREADPRNTVTHITIPSDDIKPLVSVCTWTNEGKKEHKTFTMIRHLNIFAGITIGNYFSLDITEVRGNGGFNTLLLTLDYGFSTLPNTFRNVWENWKSILEV